LIIAIDGPAGSGKSTIAKLVARRLGFAYLDTGAMYRAVAWLSLDKGIDVSDPLSADSVEAILAIARSEPISFGYQAGEPLPSQVFIGGRDVTVEIRTAEVDRAVSSVSAIAEVRAALVVQQRRFGSENDTVMEGRDIGTVVFPEAELKVFLTASAEERAQRRTIQNAERKGTSFDEAEYASVLADIQRRDRYDSTRAVSPLAAANDSVILDSTGLCITEVVSRVVELAEERR